MSKMREKESLECVRMHIWALKTQKLPGPLSGPWTPAAYCSLRSHDSASLRRQLSAAEAGAPPLTKSWIRTWICTQSETNLYFYEPLTIILTIMYAWTDCMTAIISNFCSIFPIILLLWECNIPIKFFTIKHQLRNLARSQLFSL